MSFISSLAFPSPLGFLLIVVLPIAVVLLVLFVISNFKKNTCYYCGSVVKGINSPYGILFNCPVCGQDNINKKVRTVREGSLY